MMEKSDNRAADSMSIGTTLMAALGCVAFTWMLGVKMFPTVVPGIAQERVTKGVVILDVPAYVQSQPGLSAEDRETVWAGAAGLASSLARQGYVVLRPGEVISAPEAAHVPDSVIEKWAAQASGDADSEKQKPAN